MDTEWNRRLIKKLISLLEKQENVYNSTHKHYKNRRRRLDSMNLMCEEIKKLNPYITVEAVKSKIRNLRTQYVRELRLIEISKRRGARAEDVHIPKLWCFDELDFLRNTVHVKPLTYNFIQGSYNTDVSNTEDASNMDDASNMGYDASNMEYVDEDSSSVQSSSNSRKRKQPVVVQPVQQQGQEQQQEMQLLLDKNSTKYSWLGEQVVFQINKIQSEDIQEDVAWAIQSILREGLKKDRLTRKSNHQTAYVIENISDPLRINANLAERKYLDSDKTTTEFIAPL